MWPTPTPRPIIIETPAFEIPLDGQSLAVEVVSGWQYIDSITSGMLNTVQIVLLVIIVLVGISLIIKSLKDLDNA